VPSTMARNSKRRSSPEEEEEPLEPEVDSARRSALPDSVRRNLLQASPSQRSKGSRTATLTPTPQEIFQHRRPSKLAPGGPGRSRKLPLADESQQTDIDTSSQGAAAIIAQATVPAPKARSTPASRSATIIDNADDVDGSGPEMTTQRNAEAGPSKPAHGRYAQVQETINIESDSDQLDHQSLFSSSSSIQPRAPALTRKQTIRKCKGAPFVELPYLSLPHIKTYHPELEVQHPSLVTSRLNTVKRHLVHLGPRLKTQQLPGESVNDHGVDSFPVGQQCQRTTVRMIWVDTAWKLQRMS
jgi:hypothetical protein